MSRGTASRGSALLAIGAAICAAMGSTAYAAAIDLDLPLAERIQAQWTQEDGLAQDNVYTITQTRDGFLWIGTRAGLSRFDGVHFENFGRSELQLEQTARIQALAEDSSGALWIGTGSGELLRYRGGTFERFAAKDGLKGEGRAVGRITGLAPGKGSAPGKEDELWVATYSEGIFRFEDGRFEQIAETADISSITRLAIDSSGDLWIATIGKGVFRYRQGEPVTNFTQRDGLLNDYVSSVVPSREGGVWIGTHSGICRFRDGRFEVWGEKEGMAFSHVTALREGREGSVYFTSFGGGLQRLWPDGHIDRLPTGEPGRDAIAWDVFEDQSGMIWMGTVDQGLLLFAEGAFASWRAHSEGGLSSRLVTTLAQDPAGTWWIGTRDAGLNWRRDDAAGSTSGRIGPDQGLSAEAVWALDYEEDPLDSTAGHLWVGTNRGLFRLEKGTAELWPLRELAALAELAEPPVVYALRHDQQTQWIGTDHGLLILPKPSDKKQPRLLTKAEGLPSDNVYDLEVDLQGRLWIATSGGLAVLDGTDLSRVRDYDRLAAGRPQALHCDAKGAMWVLTQAAGLVRIEAGTATALGLAQGGLLDDNLYAIAEDSQNQFWLGTSRGIVRVARSALEAKLNDLSLPLPQKLFDRLDGVDPGAIGASGKRAAIGRDGHLHMPTFGGVAVFAPEHLGQAGDPRALIKRVEVDGVLAPPGGKAALIANPRLLSFQLAAPLPHAGSKIRLRYRLYGVDSDWVEAGAERQAHYSGLVPGDYRFEAQASTTTGAYLTPPTSYSFQVAAGFLQSWRFPVALLFGLSALVWLFHLWRSHQILVRQRELDRRIAQATDNIRDLHQLLPLCASCHKVRDDQGYWQQVETYLSQSTELEFTHSFCPECAGAMMAQIEAEAEVLAAF